MYFATKINSYIMNRIIIILFCLFLISCGNSKLVTKNKLLEAELLKEQKAIAKFEKSQEFVFLQYIEEINKLNNDKNIVNTSKVISNSKTFLKHFPDNKYAWIAKTIIGEKERGLFENANNYSDGRQNTEQYYYSEDQENFDEDFISPSLNDNDYHGNHAIYYRISDPITSIPEGDFSFIFKLTKAENNSRCADLEFELLNLSGEFIKNFWLQAELLNKKGEFIKSQELLIFDNIETDQIAKVKRIWDSVDANDIGYVIIEPYIIETKTKKNDLENQKILIQPNIFDIIVSF